MAKTLILNQADLRDCVGLDGDSLAVVENAFRLLATAAVAMPPILRLDVPEHNGEVDVKTAYLPGVDHFAIGLDPWPGADRALDIVQKRFPQSEARVNQNQNSKAAEVRSVMLKDPDGINVQLGSVKYQL